MADNTDYSIDQKNTIVSGLSWAAYGAALVLTKDMDKAGVAKDAVEAAGGIVSAEQRDSISKKVSELCKKAWDFALKKNNAWNLRPELRDYNFASDLFHWDSVYTIRGRINTACRRKRQSIIKVPYKQISIDVVEQLARLMDNDPELKTILLLSELKGSIAPHPQKDTEEKEQAKTVSTEGAFSLSHPFHYYGHEMDISKVLGWIGTHKIIVVYGEGGIGKTEFCREVLERATKAAPECAVNAVNLIECRDFSQFIRRVAGVLGIATAVDDAPEKIEGRVLDGLTAASGILYLDNFEDVISETKTEEGDRKKVIGFLRKCLGKVSYTILISSRTLPQTDFSFKELDLGVLDNESAVSLFMELWGGEEKEVKEEGIEVVRDFVLKDLHKYPLNIVLAARQKRYAPGIDELKKLWAKARKKVKVSGMANPRHESIETALSITYDEVKDDKDARLLWELFTLFPEMLDASAVERILGECFEARAKLIDLSVIHSDGKNLSMLPILREYIGETEAYREDLRVLSGSLLEYYLGLFSFDRSKEMGSQRDLRGVEALGDALYFMDCMVSANNATAVSTLHELLCDYYMEGPYEAAEVLTKAVKHLSFGDVGIRANLLKYLGDLEMRTYKPENAEKHYYEAEGVYRKIHNDLGLANVLQAMGILEMRTDKLEEAEKHYYEAEGVYRKIQNDLGLANVLKAMGDLEAWITKLEEAESHYREAEIVYRRIHNDLGLANVLQAMGDLEMRIAKLEEAESHYREAEGVYRRIHTDLGLANVLQSMGDLEMLTDRLEEAESHYREAEELYRRIHADLGLASVLQTMGDLKMLTNRLEEAECHYLEAVELYRRIHADLGLAGTMSRFSAN